MRGSIRTIVAVLATALALPAAGNAAIPGIPSKWYGLPGLNAASGASWVRALAYGTPPNVVYAGLEGGGVYRSTTGGASWSAFNAGFSNPANVSIRALMASSTGTTVWAGTDGGLFKNESGTWQPVAQGAETDPANPTKLNQAVQALLGVPGGTMLAGVVSGGVYRSTDGGATWKPPVVNNGMPAGTTIWSLTSNIPGVIYATGADGVFLSVNAGSTWTRMSDGIPDAASPLTTWSYPQHPNILYTSTGSNGVYRSITGGLTWSEINDGLGAVRARGLQISPSTNGAHLYAATEDGLWEGTQTGATKAGSWIPDAPKWHQVTQSGLITPGSTNTIMWALTAPEIPGAGSLGLIAGTQSNGGYFMQFEAPDNACSTSNPSTAAPCPVIIGSTVDGKELTATHGTWTGTQIIDYAYQWQRCASTNTATCIDIDGADQSTYVIPSGSVGYRFRVQVTATNPAPTFSLVKRSSAVSTAVTPNPADLPGANQTSAPSVTILSPGDQSLPEVGDKAYAAYGITPNGFSDGWFNPKASTGVSYQWYRCDTTSDCTAIPGATARTYAITTADGTHRLRVAVTGENAAGSTTLQSPGLTNAVISSPAKIADPIPDPDHAGKVLSQAPSLSGKPYVGETLVGSVGGWVDATTGFQRRWLRCSTDGTSCSPIYKPGTVQTATDPTYQVQPADKGSVIRLRVTADVNGDLTDDGTDNHLPHAVEFDTAATAVITDPPATGGAGGGNGGGAGGNNGGGGQQPQSDAVAPVLAGVTLSKTKFVAGNGTVFSFTTTEAGKVRMVVTKATTGRKSKGICAPLTTKNRTKKKCTFQKVVTSLEQPVGAGKGSLPFTGKVGKKKLAVGTYTATLVTFDAAGNASKPVAIRFTIKRR